jgi:hypothetical protein
MRHQSSIAPNLPDDVRFLILLGKFSRRIEKTLKNSRRRIRVLTAAVRFAGIFAGIDGANVRGEFRDSRTKE